MKDRQQISSFGKEKKTEKKHGALHSRGPQILAFLEFQQAGFGK
jgi:hypothetical protein